MDFFRVWKKHLELLKEQGVISSTKKYKIFQDMDGCLVDFTQPILLLMNKSAREIDSLSPEIQKKARKALEALKSKGASRFQPEHIVASDVSAVKDYMFSLCKNNSEFWATLPWLPGGKQLWSFVSKYDVTILSAPVDQACIDGKKIWLKNNLGIDPEMAIFTRDKEKYANNNSILVDDFRRNIRAWKENDGMGVLHRDILDTIKTLRKILGE